jgi:hypothetical protein
MTRRAVRLVLFLFLVAGVAGAAYFVVVGERRMAAARQSAREFDLASVRVRDGVRDVRSAQQAYVAAAQSPAWWREQADSSLASLEDALEALRGLASEGGELDALGAASKAVTSLEDADRRARRLLADGRTEQASALIFGEALEAAAAVSQHIESARLVRWMATDRALADGRVFEAAVASGAAALALLVTLALLGERRAEPVARVLSAAPPDAVPRPAETPGRLAPIAAPPPTPRDQEAVELVLKEPAGPASGERTWSPGLDRRKAPELRATADLCTDFARLMDSQELPALLERAARLLDATGLIVWVADADSTQLRPILAHGYSAQALSRLPAIPREADNATAAAYRHSQMEIVKTNGMSPGAIAAPLLTASGCVGIMAAEIRHGREASESARALARILAAQLATLVSVVPAGTSAAPRAESIAG